MAANAVTFPLDPLPDILIWNKKVVGPIQDNSDPRHVLEHQRVGLHRRRLQLTLPR